MNVATHTIEIRDFAQQLTGLKFGHGLISTIMAYFQLARNVREGRSIIFACRQALAMCQNSCAMGSCLASYAPEIKEIRDNHIQIADTLQRLPLSFLFRKMVAESLAEWDDLADDCAIGGDSDIRKAIAEIADRL